MYLCVCGCVCVGWVCRLDRQVGRLGNDACMYVHAMCVCMLLYVCMCLCMYVCMYVCMHVGR